MRPTVVTPTAMFCGEIIFPVTAPEEFVAARSTGLTPIWWAAATCRFPKSRLLAVSLPLRKHATQPRKPLASRSEEHTSELQSLAYLVCRLLLEKKKKITNNRSQHRQS